MRAFIVRPHKLLLAAAVAIPLILFCLMMWHDYSSLLYDGIFFGVAVIVLSILAVAVNRHANSEQAATEALKAVNSELSAAHEQAENKKQLLEAVMKALPIGLAITDTQGGTIESNSAFEQIWGGPRPKTLSVDDYGAYRAWWADTGEPVGPDEWASAKAVKNGETVVGQMMRLQRFDGSETFVINSASPVRDAEGRIVGSAVAIQDISEIKKIDDELRVAKEEWERTFDSVPDLIAILDNQHRIVRVNLAMANQLNLEPSQCVGLPCYKAIHGTNAPPRSVRTAGLWTILKSTNHWWRRRSSVGRFLFQPHRYSTVMVKCTLRSMWRGI